MSPFFIKTFKSINKCPHCKADKVTGYSVCEPHLLKARNHWQSWSTVRRAEGKCCYCALKSFRGFLRCRRHREINRVKCIDWMNRHPGYAAESWAKRKARVGEGKCVACAEHRPLTGKFKRCLECRTRHDRPAPRKIRDHVIPYSLNWGTP